MENSMPTYLIHVTIENKPGISDPEGETILNDLVLKGNYSSITKIRSGKILKFQIDEKNKKSAEEKIRKLCDELRIFNPLVSKVSFEVFEN
jgi:phosphoribosylformylglycinamidine synthase|tara:strand:+ start:2015 stop:2287 length:273 start_codon:yes stop_codon:yes gene_type:complete